MLLCNLGGLRAVALNITENTVWGEVLGTYQSRSPEETEMSNRRTPPKMGL